MQRFVINKKINLNKVNQIKKKKIKWNAPRACKAIIPKPAWVINVLTEPQLCLAATSTFQHSALSAAKSHKTVHSS